MQRIIKIAEVVGGKFAYEQRRRRENRADALGKSLKELRDDYDPCIGGNEPLIPLYHIREPIEEPPASLDIVAGKLHDPESNAFAATANRLDPARPSDSVGELLESWFPGAFKKRPLDIPRTADTLEGIAGSDTLKLYILVNLDLHFFDINQFIVFLSTWLAVVFHLRKRHCALLVVAVASRDQLLKNRILGALPITDFWPSTLWIEDDYKSQFNESLRSFVAREIILDEGIFCNLSPRLLLLLYQELVKSLHQSCGTRVAYRVALWLLASFSVYGPQDMDSRRLERLALVHEYARHNVRRSSGRCELHASETFDPLKLGRYNGDQYMIYFEKVLEIRADLGTVHVEDRAVKKLYSDDKPQINIGTPNKLMQALSAPALQEKRSEQLAASTLSPAQLETILTVVSPFTKRVKKPGNYRDFPISDKKPQLAVGIPRSRKVDGSDLGLRLSRTFWHDDTIERILREVMGVAPIYVAVSSAMGNRTRTTRRYVSAPLNLGDLFILYILNETDVDNNKDKCQESDTLFELHLCFVMTIVDMVACGVISHPVHRNRAETRLAKSGDPFSEFFFYLRDVCH